ncbi:hypothetical protein ABK040_011373 [Willaertia magna]
MVEQKSQVNVPPGTTQVNFQNPQTQKVFEGVRGATVTGQPPSNESVLTGIEQAKQSIKTSTPYLTQEGKLIQKDTLELLNLIKDIVQNKNEDEKIQKFLLNFRNLTQKYGPQIGENIRTSTRQGFQNVDTGDVRNNFYNAIIGLRDFLFQFIRSNEFRNLIVDLFQYLQILAGKKIEESKQQGKLQEGTFQQPISSGQQQRDKPQQQWQKPTQQTGLLGTDQQWQQKQQSGLGGLGTEQSGLGSEQLGFGKTTVDTSHLQEKTKIVEGVSGSGGIRTKTEETLLPSEMKDVSLGSHQKPLSTGLSSGLGQQSQWVQPGIPGVDFEQQPKEFQSFQPTTQSQFGSSQQQSWDKDSNKLGSQNLGSEQWQSSGLGSGLSSGLGSTTTQQSGLGSQQSWDKNLGLGSTTQQSGLGSEQWQSSGLGSQRSGESWREGQSNLGIGQQQWSQQSTDKDELEDRLIDRFVNLSRELSRNRDFQVGLSGLFNIFNQSRSFWKQQKVGDQTQEQIDQIQRDDEFRNLLENAKAIIYEFCDAQLFDRWLDSTNEIYTNMRDDKRFKSVFSDLQDDILRYSRQPDLLENDNEKQKLKERIRTARGILEEKKNMDLTNRWIDDGNRLLQSFREDEMNAEIRERTQSLVSRLFLDEQGNFQLKPQALDQIRTILIFAIQEAINNWSGFEIVGDDGSQSYKLSNIVLKAADILPDDIKFKAKNAMAMDYGEQKTSNIVRESITTLNLKLFGMTAHLKDVNFQFDRRSFPAISDRGVMDIDFDRGGIAINIKVKARLNAKRPFSLRKCDVDSDTLHIVFKEAESHKLLLKMLSPIIQGRVRTQIVNNLYESLETNLRDFINRLNFLIERGRLLNQTQSVKNVKDERSTWSSDLGQSWDKDSKSLGSQNLDVRDRKDDRVGEHTWKSGPSVSETKLETEGVKQYDRL